MDFDAYAQTAVNLANLPPTAPVDPEIVFGEDSHAAAEVTEKDLGTLRRAGKKLRHVFELGAAGADGDAVEQLNALLVAYPVQPRISGHDASDWHMHATSRGAGVAAEYVAAAVWGLSVWLCAHGSDRFGVCADEHCGNVYLDTSSNNCRRFCSERCATRSHVAAHRARKRAAAVT
ncbi:CGNR zinc finger domain-containing protein [Actinocatenispora rupis]|uniref:CGNR zinc finger domain-containing protein n=1 Tax=Actinocatenispora rupis TaxID=519421 RepID=UPI001942E9B8|nr:CGNR zinc finger domain-containing protein [Actinocatenispora rupis]